MERKIEVSDNFKIIGLLLISFFGGIITSTLTDILTDFDRTLTLAISLIFVMLGAILVLYNRLKGYLFKIRLHQMMEGGKR